MSSSESPPGYRSSQGLSFFPSVPLDKLWVSRLTLKSSHKIYLSHPSKLAILYHPVTWLYIPYILNHWVSWRNYKLSILWSKTLLLYYSSWWRQLNQNCTEFECDEYQLSCTYREALAYRYEIFILWHFKNFEVIWNYICSLGSSTLKKNKNYLIFIKETKWISSRMRVLKLMGLVRKKWAAPLMEVPFTECSNENGTVSNQGNV